VPAALGAATPAENAADGDSANEDDANGDAANGDAANGGEADSDATNEESTNEETTNDDETNDDETNGDPTNDDAENGDESPPAPSPWNVWTFIGGISALAFGLILMLLVVLLVLQTKIRWKPFAIVRLVGLTLVIFTAVIVMFLPEREVSKSVMGLLGAIAGYLLGKDPRGGDFSEKSSADPQPGAEGNAGGG